MAMAKILLLILLVVVTAVVEAADPPAKWKAALTALDAMDAKMRQAVDGVAAAAPAEKQSEVQEAAMAERLDVSLALARVEETGNEKKVESMAASYEKAADLVVAAPPPDKLKVMKEAFRAVTKAAAL
ncbi:hypothetical protein BDA96_05G023800 [Sorghum bicolor]|uniref:Uncharacterized protein n=3 Tax=Sorghum bicolor TaxID=4558 RepID=A0A921UFG4_SORBI|nr:hypothetical protein SORBI_3005G023700 [Sorghum bicolor]KAG0528581.1 hypothetical protein BDA96_05G023800 [Sorghum bicolor]